MSHGERLREGAVAEELAAYEFPRRGRPTKYCWDQWLDGRIWRLTAEDFMGATPTRFRQAALSAAARRKIPISTHIDGEAVVIQAQRAEAAA